MFKSILCIVTIAVAGIAAQLCSSGFPQGSTQGLTIDQIQQILQAQQLLSGTPGLGSSSPSLGSGPTITIPGFPAGPVPFCIPIQPPGAPPTGQPPICPPCPTCPTGHNPSSPSPDVLGLLQTLLGVLISVLGGGAGGGGMPAPGGAPGGALGGVLGGVLGGALPI